MSGWTFTIRVTESRSRLTGRRGYRATVVGEGRRRFRNPPSWWARHPATAQYHAETWCDVVAQRRDGSLAYEYKTGVGPTHPLAPQDDSGQAVAR